MDMPKRPLWSYKLDKLQLEKQEEKYFRDYITQFYSRHNMRIAKRQHSMTEAQGVGDTSALNNHSTEQLVGLS